MRSVQLLSLVAVGALSACAQVDPATLHTAHVIADLNAMNAREFAPNGCGHGPLYGLPGYAEPADWCLGGRSPHAGWRSPAHDAYAASGFATHDEHATRAAGRERDVADYYRPHVTHYVTRMYMTTHPVIRTAVAPND